MAHLVAGVFKKLGFQCSVSGPAYVPALSGHAVNERSRAGARQERPESTARSNGTALLRHAPSEHWSLASAGGAVSFKKAIKPPPSLLSKGAPSRLDQEGGPS